jgi:hypothetical protein
VQRKEKAAFATVSEKQEQRTKERRAAASRRAANATKASFEAKRNEGKRFLW